MVKGSNQLIQVILWSQHVWMHAHRCMYVCVHTCTRTHTYTHQPKLLKKKKRRGMYVLRLNNMPLFFILFCFPLAWQIIVKSTGELCLRSTATPCVYNQCMDFPNPKFKLFLRSYLFCVWTCVMVCLMSEVNTENCFSPFTFPWIPGIKLKSLGVYNKHLTRPCYTDLKLCEPRVSLSHSESYVCVRRSG